MPLTDVFTAEALRAQRDSYFAMGGDASIEKRFGLILRLWPILSTGVRVNRWRFCGRLPAEKDESPLSALCGSREDRTGSKDLW